MPAVKTPRSKQTNMGWRIITVFMSRCLGRLSYFYSRLVVVSVTLS